MRVWNLRLYESSKDLKSWEINAPVVKVEKTVQDTNSQRPNRKKAKPKLRIKDLKKNKWKYESKDVKIHGA